MKHRYRVFAFLILSVLIFAGCLGSPQLVETIPPELPTETIVEDVPLTPVGFEIPVQSSPALDLQTQLTDVYRLANPAVVYIVTALGSGSGFLYDDQGHIVTNSHVVSSGSQFEVVFANGERRQARLKGADLDSDLAVIQSENPPADIAPLKLGDYWAVEVGQIVVAIGNPFGEQGSMSMGIVSGVGRSLPSQRSSGRRGSYSLPEVLQTDAPINPGNSGGPLLNLNGEVIGVNSAIASETGASSGVGFAIPVSALQKIIPSLIKDGKYTYSYMGASFDDEISLSEKQAYGITQTQGVYVLDVSPGSPASRAGLLGADPNTGQGGDLIVAIDGSKMEDFGDLNSYLVFFTSPGQTIEITVVREGQEIILPLVLGARP